MVRSRMTLIVPLSQHACIISLHFEHSKYSLLASQKCTELLLSVAPDLPQWFSRRMSLELVALLLRMHVSLFLLFLFIGIVWGQQWWWVFLVV